MVHVWKMAVETERMSNLVIQAAEMTVLYVGLKVLHTKTDCDLSLVRGILEYDESIQLKR